MLESFLQAQKVSVRNSLQRSFRKYLTFGEEHNQLLMHQLQGLIRDAEKYHQVSIHSLIPYHTMPHHAIYVINCTMRVLWRVIDYIPPSKPKLIVFLFLTSVI
jgi:hypothetical protein